MFGSLKFLPLPLSLPLSANLLRKFYDVRKSLADDALTFFDKIMFMMF